MNNKSLWRWIFGSGTLFAALFIALPGHAEDFVDSYVSGVADYQSKLHHDYPKGTPPIEAQIKQYSESMADAQRIYEEDRVKARAEVKKVLKQVDQEINGMLSTNPDPKAKPTLAKEDPKANAGKSTAKSSRANTSTSSGAVEEGGATRVSSFHRAKPSLSSGSPDSTAGAQSVGSFSKENEAGRSVSSFSKDTGGDE